MCFNRIMEDRTARAAEQTADLRFTDSSRTQKLCGVMLPFPRNRKGSLLAPSQTKLEGQGRFRVLAHPCRAALHGYMSPPPVAHEGAPWCTCAGAARVVAAPRVRCSPPGCGGWRRAAVSARSGAAAWSRPARSPAGPSPPPGL